MAECTQSYFIRDGRILSSNSFDIGYLNDGTSIYEVARLDGTKLLFLDDHIDRLFTSLEIEGLESTVNRLGIYHQIEKLIEQNAAEKGNIKFVLNFGDEKSSHFFAYFTTHRYPTSEDYRKGIKVISFPFERIEPNKKVWRPEFRNNVAATIKENKAWEAFLLDTNGLIPEASRSNIFGIKDGKAITPPDEFILTGITRKYVLNACRNLNIPIELRMIDPAEIGNLDALFMTSTSLHVIPVRQYDEILLPVENAIMRKIMKQFQSILENHLV